MIGEINPAMSWGICQASKWDWEERATGQNDHSEAHIPPEIGVIYCRNIKQGANVCDWGINSQMKELKIILHFRHFLANL